MSGTELITNERQRQITDEGWTPEHDAEHKRGELAKAAACYAWPPPRPLYVKQAWPWDREWWKPTIPASGAASNAGEKRDARIRDLVKAGALIAAEIDRLLASPDTLTTDTYPVMQGDELREIEIPRAGTD